MKEPLKEPSQEPSEAKGTLGNFFLCGFHRQFFLLLFFSIFVSCSAAPHLKGVKVTRTTVESTVTTTSSGTVRAQQQSALAFGGPGRIASAQVKMGDRVRKGQILAELENKDLKVVLEDATKELKRTEDLFASGLVSKAALDEGKKVFEIAHSNLLKTQIIAPFDGMVTEVHLEVGELDQGANQAKSPAVRLIDLKPRIIRAEIDEIDLPKVKTGTRARVRIQAIHGNTFEAEVQKVVPFVSTVREQDRTSEIELKFVGDPSDRRAGSNATTLAEAIPVGASVEVEMIIHSKKDVLALPSRAILGHSDHRYVYRWDGKKLHRSPIKIGIGNYLKTEVLEGLKDGEIVIFPPDTIDISDQMSVNVELTQWP